MNSGVTPPVSSAASSAQNQVTGSETAVGAAAAGRSRVPAPAGDRPDTGGAMLPERSSEPALGTCRVVAVLLAAGESTRMGEGALKALLEWDGKPLIGYQVEQLLATTLDRVIVVLGYRANDLVTLLPHHARLETVSNQDYRSGKVSSIVAGVRAAPGDSPILVLGVDQPRPSSLVQRVVDAHLASGAPITIAGVGGRRGHPVVFAPALRPELLSISEETQGLRAVLQRHSNWVDVCETGSPLALVNLNTPEDYAAARALVAPR